MLSLYPWSKLREKNIYIKEVSLPSVKNYLQGLHFRFLRLWLVSVIQKHLGRKVNHLDQSGLFSPKWWQVPRKRSNRLATDCKQQYHAIIFYYIRWEKETSKVWFVGNSHQRPRMKRRLQPANGFRIMTYNKHSYTHWILTSWLRRGLSLEMLGNFCKKTHPKTTKLHNWIFTIFHLCVLGFVTVFITLKL